MKTLLKYLKMSSIYLVVICITSLILAILNFFGVLNSRTISIIDALVMIVIFIVLGYIHGKKSEKHGYRVGLKIGLIFSLILLFLSIVVFRSGVSFTSSIYYLILIVSCVFGSMIGINKKSD